MPIRMTGINSGLDTDTIVQALVSSYSYKKDKYKKEQTKLQWTQDAWKTLNTKVYSLYSNVSNLRFSSSYNLKKTTSSNPNKATVTASNSAANGSHKLNIIKVAQAGSLTGGKLGSSITGSSTLAELGYTVGEGTITVKAGEDKNSTIKINNSTTVDDVVNQLKKAGLNASFDTTNKRFFVSSKTTGKDADFELTGDSKGAIALAKLGLSVGVTAGTDDSGNPIYTEEGKTYQKYAAFADGVADPDSEEGKKAIAAKIEAAMTAYRDAATTKEQSEQQISNLTSAFGYADSYANMQEFYSAHQGVVGEKERFENVITSYSKGTTNLVTGTGEIYRATTGADTDGNTVFGYANSDGEKQYMSKEVIYTDGTNSYRKNKSGEYIDISDENKKFDGDTSTLKESSTNYYSVTEKMEYELTDEDGNKTSYTVTKSMIPDGEGGTKAQYSFEKDGKTYISDKETGEYKNADQEDDKISVSSLKYSYEKGTQILGVESVENAYKKYAEDYTISEEQAQSLKTDISKVNTFEKQANDGTSLTYSKENIKDEIQKAYESNGRTGINDLVEQFSEAISTNRTDADKAQETMDANIVVKDLAGLEDGTSELASELDAMVNNVLAAVEVLNAPNKYSGGATKMNGQDAVIVLDGVTYENATNGIEINGMTINALAATGDGDENAITITTATDAQGIYDKIKDFITEYNNIINEMSKLYNADSAKGYEPLTDDEKDAMSDKEVEKWETKVKDALLRRDSTLGGIMTTMTNAMATGFEIDGKKYSLSSFGIKTMGYLNATKNENYAYHIDGDEDDENTSGKTDKLMSMINSDPDTVLSFFQQLATNLYQELGNKMKSTSLSSSYTIYNDKQMTKKNTQYTQLIKEWETKVSEKEDYYYKKFSAMETALAKLNSTQSSLSGYFS